MLKNSNLFGNIAAIYDWALSDIDFPNTIIVFRIMQYRVRWRRTIREGAPYRGHNNLHIRDSHHIHVLKLV